MRTRSGTELLTELLDEETGTDELLRDDELTTRELWLDATKLELTAELEIATELGALELEGTELAGTELDAIALDGIELDTRLLLELRTELEAAELGAGSNAG